MLDVLIENLKKRFQFYADLASQVDDDTINAEIDVPRHRSLGLHLWCVVGTRESYAKGIAADGLQGWSSSVAKLNRDEFMAKLASSSEALLAAIESVDEWTPERERLLAEVAEHEVMHEGQIIRVMFGLQKPLPSSCHWAVCD